MPAEIWSISKHSGQSPDQAFFPRFGVFISFLYVKKTVGKATAFRRSQLPTMQAMGPRSCKGWGQSARPSALSAEEFRHAQACQVSAPNAGELFFVMGMAIFDTKPSVLGSVYTTHSWLFWGWFIIRVGINIIDPKNYFHYRSCSNTRLTQKGWRLVEVGELVFRDFTLWLFELPGQESN